MEESNIHSRSMLSGLSLLFLVTTLTTTLVPVFYAICPRALAPAFFYMGDRLQVKVSNLNSPDTQLSYNLCSFGYCKPFKTKNNVLALKEFLQGEAFRDSVYTFDMRIKQSCKVACRVKLDAEASKKLEKIHDNYRVNM
ncbi:hypothetical protein DITRI_Ditri03aG0053600 [Diplodiscus trichospermus]